VPPAKAPPPRIGEMDIRSKRLENMLSVLFLGKDASREDLFLKKRKGDDEVKDKVEANFVPYVPAR